MMTQKEQEEKIFDELSKIKPILERHLGYKISKRNFKKSIVDFMPILSEGIDENEEISSQEKKAIGDFFSTCNPHLGDIIWANVKKKTLNIKISYEDHDLTSWHIPVGIIFQREENFKTCASLLVKGLGDSLFAFFLSPDWRQMVIDGDEEAVKVLYSSFSRPSMGSCLSNLIMIRDCFPDFYKHITSKMDIMTVEDMQKFIKNKKTQNGRNRTKKH